MLQERAKEMRQRVLALKLAAGCAVCGFNAHGAALEFDHLPGFQKVNDVSKLVRTGNWASVEAEIAKCEIVCANCHRIRTFERRGQAAGVDGQ